MKTARRVVSGMRPTGGLHLGHLRGVLHNWRALQAAGDTCFFFVADWHALTTDYAAPEDLPEHTRNMVVAWLAAGLDPSRAVIFRQSDVPAHAELFVLLSMICPLPWLMRLPTYKEQSAQQGLDTHGFLGYPLLQSADIMIYGAERVPVGEDQAPHIEFTREIARRFNHLYGGSKSFIKRREAAFAKINGDIAGQLHAHKKTFARDGDAGAVAAALAIIDTLAIDDAEKQTLRDDLHYGGEEILRVPQTLLTTAPRLPGTDGRKMSKSYGNTIELFDSPQVVRDKIAGMQTDPARVKRTDKGEPERCPVWGLHRIFSDDDTRKWAAAGCRSADIGCVDCKKRLSEFINAELSPVAARRREVDKPGVVENLLADGARQAAAAADETMDAVRRAVRLRS